MSNQSKREEEFNNLTLANTFMFGEVMCDEKTSKGVLEIILGINIEKVVLVEKEKHIDNLPARKSIRLDIYVRDEEETIYNVVEDQPEFPGGMQALMKYLRDNIKYPSISRQNNSQGRAYINFVVNTDGSITDVEVMKSTNDVYLDKEAVRVVSGMPKWKPGKQQGKTVRVKYTLPVMFRLQ